MKYKTINGIKYLVDTTGAIMKDAQGADVVVDEATAGSMTEFVAEETNINNEDVATLKAYIKTLATEEATEAVKALKLGKDFSIEVQKAMAEVLVSAGKEVTTDMNAKMKTLTDGLGKVKSKAGASFEFDVKSLSELSSLTGEVIVPERDTDITRTSVRESLLETMADSGGTSSNKVTWTEVLTETGAPATTAELATFAEKDYTFGIYSAPVLKVTVMSKHSTEILEDMPELVNAVRAMVQEDLNLKVEDKLYSGAGGADFTGVRTNAVAFAAGTIVIGATANNFDVLRVALQQIEVVGKGKFKPNMILMNPVDVAKMELTKDTTGNYVMPPFTTSERTTIKGVRIVPTTLVTAGDFLVGDFTKLHIRNKRGFNIQVATENGTDFEKDILTIRASRRLAVYMRVNEYGAFVKGTFATAITDLTS